jgi:hypothetical protein
MVRFVDLVEAFASINREMMWQILAKYGIPPGSLVNDRVRNDGRDDVSESIDVYESYGVSRSFRRGSNTLAINQGVTEATINHNNRWSIVERAKGMAPKLGMQQHYSDVLQLLPTLLRYSSAL